MSGLDLRTRRRLGFASVYLGLALLFTQHHDRHVNSAPRIHKWRMQRHEQVLGGTGRAPWTYRVLAPALVETTRPLFVRLSGDADRGFELAYLAWRLAFTFALLALFHAYLRAWVDPAWACAGTLFVAALHPSSYEGAWFHLNSVIDLTLWLIAALLTLRRRHAWLFPLIAVASLNREASIFIAAVHAALCLPREPFRRVAARTAGLLACWAIPFLALRAVIGLPPWAEPVARIAARNLQHPEWWLWVASFFGAFWVLGLLHLRRSPPELRWLAVFLAPYLLLQLVFGRLIEARLFLPLALALVPVGLLALQDRADKQS